MANDFYQHSGHPGTRAPRSSALLRAEFAAIEDGFDKLPDVGTANLFSVSNGSALVGKTAAQAKVILALDSVPNLDTTAAVSHTSLTDNPHSVTKAQVGLGSVPNLDTTNAVAHILLTDNPHSVTAEQVGLGNCDNTADADKPISDLTQGALDLKAPLADPTLTGTVTIPTAATTSNATVAASTAFVRNAINTLFDGSVVSSSGYQKFHNGIVVQWGEDATHGTANTPSSTSYLLAFDSGPFALVATPYSSASPNTTLFCAWNHSTTAFQHKAAVSSLVFRWIAIGFITPA